MKPAYEGGVAAVVTVGVAAILPEVAQFFLLAALLILTGGIYVGLAVADGRKGLPAESAQAAALIAACAAAWWVHPVFLGVGWLLHPVWDLLHAPHRVGANTPAWVVPWCLVYDVVVGAAAVYWAFTAW